jgi:hypothetical protein
MMTTPLDGPLRRELSIDGVTYMFVLDDAQPNLVGKGKRKGIGPCLATSSGAPH